MHSSGTQREPSSAIHRGRILIIGIVLAVIAVTGGAALSGALMPTPQPAVRMETPQGSPSPAASPTVVVDSSPATVATEVPSATARPTIMAAVGFEPSPGVLPPGAVIVPSTDLQLYLRPADLSTPTMVAMAGDRLTIMGPLVIAGERWYELRSVDNPMRSGYVALDPAGDQVSIEAVVCPTVVPSIASLASLTGWERLTCYGDMDITLEGYEIVGFGGFRPGTYEPEWLNGYLGALAIAEPDETGRFEDFLFVHLEPGVDATRPPVDGNVGTALLRIDGHFNHPASTGCTATDIPITDDLEGATADYEPIAAEIVCRQAFVVTRLEVVGAS